MQSKWNCLEFLRVARERGDKQHTSEKSVFLRAFAVRVNYPFPSFTATDELNTNDRHKPLSQSELNS